MSNRTCKDCKKEFTPTRDWQVFCSIACGNRARSKKRAKRIKKAFRIAKEAIA